MWYLERWNKYYQYLKEYYAEYGTANVPADYITDDGFCLGTWVVYQRTKKRNGLLSEEQKQLLDQVSMIWNLKDDKWDSKAFNHVCANIYLCPLPGRGWRRSRRVWNA